MKDRILFWLDANLIHYGIANSLQNQCDCELYAIISITNKPKKFFMEQKFVKFSKTWFYFDHIKKSTKNPDIQYLSSFEKRPAYSEPKDTIIAPVSVAKLIMNSGLNFFSVKTLVIKTKKRTKELQLHE